MQRKKNENKQLGAPLRVLEIGGFGSNWTVKAIKVPGITRYSTITKQKEKFKSTKSNSPLRVLSIGGWGSKWEIKAVKVPGLTRYKNY